MGTYEPLSLRANFQWTFVSNVIFSVTQWLVLIVIVRLGSRVLVGQFALGLAISAPIFMFTNMNLRAVLTTDRVSRHPFRNYLGVRIATAAISIAVVYGVFTAFSFDEAALGVVLLVALSKGVQGVSDIFHGAFQKHERMDLMSISRVAQGTVGALSLTVAMLLTASLEWGLWALSAAWLAVVFLFDAPLAWRVLGQRDPNTIAKPDPTPKPSGVAYSTWWSSARDIVWLAIPLGVTAGVASINENIPRYFVESLLGTEQLGLFASIAYMMRLLGVFGTAISAAALPRLAQFYAEGERARFAGLTSRLASVAAVLGLVGVITAALVGDHILVLAYGPDYREQAVFIAVMAAAGADVMMRFLNQGLLAARRFKASLVVQILVAVSTFVGSLALIPTFGLVGAGLALAVGLTIGAMATWLYLRNVIARFSPSVSDVGREEAPGSDSGRFRASIDPDSNSM